MALKKTWKDLVDSTTGYDGDDASAEPINEIAHAVIELEENTGDVETALDGIIAMQNELIGGGA